MADLTIKNLVVTDNESGLVHIVEADLSDGKTTKRCHVEFIDMPMFDAEGELRMDAVGSMLMAKFTEPEFVPPKPDPDAKPEPMPEPIEVEPVAIDPDYLAERKAKLATLKTQVAAAPKTITVKGYGLAEAVAAPIEEEPIKEG
jgi:hypothetical protein